MEKLNTIQIDLDVFKIILQFHGEKEPLVIHFDTPSRRFYFSVIALIINEMKKQGESGFVHIHKYKEELKLLDESLSVKHASKHIDGLLAKIRIAWRHRLPDLETATLFKVIDRDLISPYEKGGKYRYECSDVECDTWTNLFGYDESNKWRFKFAIDSVAIGLNDISVTLGELRDNSAWDEFVRRVSGQPKTVSIEKKGETNWWKIVALALAITSAVGFAGVAIWNFYLRPAQISTRLELPEKPSIAVLPLNNLSGDPKQEFFCDGITEDIITALSKFQRLFVIARHSTFTYKGKPVNVKQVSRDLGVQYVLEGSVRMSGERVRVNAQLIDAVKGNHIWAERYDRKLSDIFSVQDELTKEIIQALNVELTEGEQARKAGKGTDSLEAYLKFMQARENCYRHNIEGIAIAQKLAEEAISLDPNYASAYRILGVTHMHDVFLGRSKSPKESLAKAINLAKKAIDLDGTNGYHHATLGFMYTLVNKYDEAIIEAERGAELDPNLADIHGWLGLVYRYTGRWDEAILSYKKAIRLNPIPPSWYLYGLGQAYAWTGQCEKGIKAGQRAIEGQPDSLYVHLFMTATYSLCGQEDNAIEEAAEVLRINPKFSLANFEKSLGFKNQNDHKRFFSALRRAGLK